MVVTASTLATDSRLISCSTRSRSFWTNVEDFARGQRLPELAELHGILSV